MTQKKPASSPSAYERNTFGLLHALLADSENWGRHRDRGGSTATLAARNQALSKDAMLERIEQLHAMRRELLRLRKEARRLRATKGFID